MKNLLILFALSLLMTGCYTQMAVNDTYDQEYQDYYADNNSDLYSDEEGVVYDTVYYDDDEYIDSDAKQYKGFEDKTVTNIYIDGNSGYNTYDPFWDTWNSYWRIQAWWSPTYYFDGFIMDWWHPRPIVYAPYWDPFWNPFYDPWWGPYYDPYYCNPYWGGGYYSGGTITKTHPGHTRNNDGGRNSGERTRRIKEIKEVTGNSRDLVNTRNRNDKGTVSRNDDKRVSRERDILNDRNISTNRIKRTNVDRTDVNSNRTREVTTNRNDNSGTDRTKINVRKDTQVRTDREIITNNNRTETRTNDTNDKQRKTIYVKRENTNSNNNTKTNNKTDREYQRYTGQNNNTGSTSRTNTNTNTERKRETRNDNPQIQNTQPPVRNDYTPPVRNDGGNRSSGNNNSSGRNSGDSGNRGRR